MVSATTKNKDIKIIADSYKALNFNRVIITKLDETSTYGSILNIIKEVEVPFKFYNYRSKCSEDIKCPESSEIARLNNRGEKYMLDQASTLRQLAEKIIKMTLKMKIGLLEF